GLQHRHGLQLRAFRFGAVDAVARHAGHVARVVHPAEKVRVRALVVAGETGLVHRTCRHRGEALDVFLFPGIHVLLTRAVTRLTHLARPGRGRADVLCFAVQRLVERLGFRIVTGRAGVVADQTGRLTGWRCGAVR